MIGLDFFLKFYSRESELTIFDVEKHDGESVNEFITLYPNSRIFAFEPDQTNFARLNERFWPYTSTHFQYGSRSKLGSGFVYIKNGDNNIVFVCHLMLMGKSNSFRRSG